MSIQLILIMGLGSDKWGGGHYDDTKISTYNGIATTLGDQAGPCGCTGAGIKFIESRWNTPGYLNDDLFVLVFDTAVASGSETTLGPCKVVQHRNQDVHNSQIDSELSTHDHEIPPYRIYITYDASGGAVLGSGSITVARRLESVEDLDEKAELDEEQDLPTNQKRILGVVDSIDVSSCLSFQDICAAPSPNTILAAISSTDWPDTSIFRFHEEAGATAVLNPDGWQNFFTYTSSNDVDCPVKSCFLGWAVDENSACNYALDIIMGELDISTWQITVKLDAFLTALPSCDSSKFYKTQTSNCQPCPGLVNACNSGSTGSHQSMIDCYTQCFDRSALMAHPWCIKCSTAIDYTMAQAQVTKIIGKVSLITILQQKESSQAFPDQQFQYDSSNDNRIQVASDISSFFDVECTECHDDITCSVHEYDPDQSYSCDGSTALQASDATGQFNFDFNEQKILQCQIDCDGCSSLWKNYLCIQCIYNTEIPYRPNPSDSKVIKEFLIEQDEENSFTVELINDCTNKLIAPLIPVQSTYDWDDNTISKPVRPYSYGETLDVIFQNSDVNCSVSQCTSNITELTVQIPIYDQNSPISQQFPFSILLKPEGQRLTALVTCQTGTGGVYDSSQSFEWTIIQNPSDCHTTMIQPIEGPETLNLLFDQSIPSTIIYPKQTISWFNYFQPQNLSCSLDTCVLVESDCNYAEPLGPMTDCGVSHNFGNCNCAIGATLYYGKFTGTINDPSDPTYIDFRYNYHANVTTVASQFCGDSYLGDPVGSAQKRCFCGSSTFSQDISISQTDPWEITASLQTDDAMAGVIQPIYYSHTICVACKNIGNQWVTTLPWTIKLISLDCSLVPLNVNPYFFDIGSTETIDVTTLFQITGDNKADALCQINNADLFIDADLTNLYNGKLTLAGLIASYDTSVPSVTHEVIYIKVQNQVSDPASIPVTILVCGGENVILVDQSTLVLTYDLYIGQQTLKLTDFETQFKSLQQGCPIISYRLTEYDSLGDIQDIQDDNIHMDSEFAITMDTNSTYNKIIFIEASTKNSDNKAYKQVHIQVICGQETVTLVDQSTLVLSYSFNSGQQTLKLSEYENLFETSDKGCPVVSYRLIQYNPLGEILDFRDEDIQMNSDFSVSVETLSTYNKDILIEASTNTSENKAVMKVIVQIQNFAPYFEEGRPEMQKIEMSSSSQSVYQIPKVIDQENLNQTEITVKVSGLEQSFMRFDQVSNQIIFKGAQKSQEGSYIIKVTLEDAQGKSSSFEIEFQIKVEGVIQQIAPEYIIEIEEFIPIQEEEGEYKKVEEFIAKEGQVVCKALITEVTYFGRTSIHFNQRMKTDIDLTLIDETILDVYVMTGDKRHLADAFDLSQLNLTWIAHSFIDQDLTLNVTFLNARAISPSLLQDYLVVNFKNVSIGSEEYHKRRQLFVTKEENIPLALSHRVLTQPIQRQIEDTKANRNYAKSTQITTSGILGTIVITFIMQLFMAGALSFMIGWINTLQIIIHLPMLKILVPANVNLFFQLIIPIVTFDVIPPEWSTEYIMEFEEFPENWFIESFNEKFFGQMQSLGYDTHNSVQILGSLWLFSALFYLRLLVLWPLVKATSIYVKKLMPYSQRLLSRLLFGEIILISLEAYFEFLIGGYMNSLYHLDTASGESVGTISGYYSLIVGILILPAFMIYVLVQPLEVLRQPNFQQKWGSLYEGIRLENKWQVANFAVFMMRRASFILIAFNIDNYPGIQMILCNLLNLVSCVYYGKVKPLDSRFKTRLDYFNEFLITLVTWHMMFFTDFVPDENVKYLMGWSMVASICLNTFVNLAIVLTKVGRTLFFVIIKYYTRLLAKIVQSKPGYEFNRQISKQEDYTTLNVLKFYQTYEYKPPKPPVLTEAQHAKALRNCKRMMELKCDKPVQPNQFNTASSIVQLNKEKSMKRELHQVLQTAEKNEIIQFNCNPNNVTFQNQNDISFGDPKSQFKISAQQQSKIVQKNVKLIKRNTYADIKMQLNSRTQRVAQIQRTISRASAIQAQSFNQTKNASTKNLNYSQSRLVQPPFGPKAKLMVKNKLNPPQNPFTQQMQQDELRIENKHYFDIIKKSKTPKMVKKNSKWQ